MQQKRKLLNEIKNTKTPSLVPTDVLRAHRGIAPRFKFKEARNQSATDIKMTINSIHNTLYNLIRDSRKNTTQRISIAITPHFSKPREVLHDRDLVAPATAVMHKRYNFNSN